MSNWILPTLWVLAIFAGIYLVGRRKWRRQAAELNSKRPNPSRDEFVAILGSDCESDLAAFLWETLDVYYRPRATPHPDDDLIREVGIDPDEPDDWVQEFDRRFGLNARILSDWPTKRPVTARNLARWLSENRSPAT